MSSVNKDEMEKYRDEDRQQEADQIPLTESQQKQEELEPIEGEEQDNPELFKTEIDYPRYWKDMYEKEHKLRLEAEGETHLVKAVGMNSPEMKSAKSEVEALKQQQHTDRNEFKTHSEEAERTIKNLEARLAELLEVDEAHQKLNGKLQERLTEVEGDNKKLADQIEDKINQMRRSGM
jgi:chromosome segregation ATPase